MTNETPSLTPLQMEELIELVQSDPGLYNQTKKIHKDQIWTINVWQKISKKLDVEIMTGRTICIAYSSGQESKLTLYCGYSRYKLIADNLTQYPDRGGSSIKKYIFWRI